VTPNERNDVLAALEEWANKHPQGDRVFLVFMGRSFTPLEYYNEVLENGDFREKLFQFLEEQAERSKERPVEMIWRAVAANRV
jgi:hypothetical protein